MTELVIGKLYRVRHSRKGTFVLRLQSRDEDSVTGLITEGTARMINGYHQGPGDVITVRLRLCLLTLI